MMFRNMKWVTLVIIAVMSVLFGTESKAASGNQEWKWPVPGSDRMSSCYLDGRSHYAIDIQADNGEEVYASYYGEVIDVYETCTHNYKKSYSCCDGGLGNNVYVRHIYNGKSYVSRYGHLSDVYVSVGDIVTEDTVIGAVGTTGYSSGFHLDFRVYEGSTAGEDSKANAIDPLMELFIELPEGFHANATTGCCYRYEDEVVALYAENPKVVVTEREEELTTRSCESSYLCENRQLPIDIAVFGDLWVRRALSAN